MNSALSPKAIQYSPGTIRRAQVAFLCTTLNWPLLAAMKDDSVALPTIAGKVGFDAGYCRRILSEAETETTMMWLIQVGLLRREVDGQGLTDSFRLTPLGRAVLAQWQTSPSLPAPSLKEKWWNRWCRWRSQFAL